MFTVVSFGIFWALRVSRLDFLEIESPPQEIVQKHYILVTELRTQAFFHSFNRN